MTSSDVHDALLGVHELLVARAVIAPLTPEDDEVRRWLEWELASLIEGHFHRSVDARWLPAAERLDWERRVTTDGLRDPRLDDFRRAYWLLQEGDRAGTVAIDSSRLGRSEVGITSLYVRPDFRRRGIASRALDAAYDTVAGAGADGLRIETSWCWQPAVRFYLGLGLWVRNWKHSLVFTRSKGLCPYRVDMDGRCAMFSVLITGTWMPLIEAENRGRSLGWRELDAHSSLVAQDAGARGCHLAAGTFALHLAVAGWPLVRSRSQWARRHDWSDMGMPEGLAYKIAVFESVDRRRGYDVRTPRIPGLDYDTAC